MIILNKFLIIQQNKHSLMVGIVAKTKTQIIGVLVGNHKFLQIRIGKILAKIWSKM